MHDRDDDDSLVEHAPVSSHEVESDAEANSGPACTEGLTARSRKKSKRKLKLRGRRVGVAVSSITAGLVFLVNLVLTIWASTNFPVVHGIGTAYSGDCDTVGSRALWLHPAINALSSILLSASNYTMQCLSEPTRKECDMAHAKGDWLDIGVLGTRNHFRIGWHRGLLWLTLAVTSVPLHLMYNSAVFKSLQANDYTVVVANPSFLTPAHSSGRNDGMTGVDTNSTHDLQAAYQKDASSFQRLSPSECIAAFGTSYVSAYSGVIAITNDQSNVINQTSFYNNTVNIYGVPGPGVVNYNWICLDLDPRDKMYCNIANVQRQPSNWTMNGHLIDHCLAEVSKPLCKLQFSVYIMVAVIVSNAVKALTMLWTFWKQREITLVVVGDAIASYLEKPDLYTEGRCLMAKSDVDKGPLQWRTQRTIGTRQGRWPQKGVDVKSTRPNTTPPATSYDTRRARRWFAAASRKRWWTTTALCVTALLVALGFLLSSWTNIATYAPGQSIWQVGFGATDSRNLIDSDFLARSGYAGSISGHALPEKTSADNAFRLIGSVLIANLPQTFVSFLYLMYNGLLTCMLLSHEWSQYGVRARGLRVTDRSGDQRSSFRLQLPYGYSVPLLIAMATLHWLVSQSLFLARVDVFKDGVELPSSDITTCGYSAAPLLGCVVLGSVMLLLALVMGFRRFKSAMPVASSCSVAIAAACHRPAEDRDAAVLPVKWGEVQKSEDGREVGHCCFSSFDVQDLTVNRMYAGVDIRRRDMRQERDRQEHTN